MLVEESRIVKEIGKGTFGNVFAIKIESKLFAVKIIKFDGSKELKTILKEVEILEKLASPLIVKFFGSKIGNHNVWIYMDLIRGINLDQARHFAEDGRFKCSEIKSVAAEIVSATMYLHSIGILHNDIKPENILLTIDGHVKLTDFGSASKINDFSKEIRGSLGYLAPEVLSRKGCSPMSEIWSIGCTLFELIHGFRVFISIQAVHKNNPEFFDDVSEIKPLIEKMLEKDPNFRINFEEIKNDSFFENIDWNQTNDGKLIPTICFNGNDDFDVSTSDSLLVFNDCFI